MENGRKRPRRRRRKLAWRTKTSTARQSAKRHGLPSAIGARPRSIKVRSRFARWLKFEAVRRGMFVYQLVEQLAAEAQEGKRPWQR